MTNFDNFYSDISPDMSMSWDRDVARVTGKDAVKYSLVGIITTRKGSRPFMPDFGCDIANALFELFDVQMAQSTANDVAQAVLTYEPRVATCRVRLLGTPDKNELTVTIMYTLHEDPDVIETLKFNLKQMNEGVGIA